MRNYCAMQWYSQIGILHKIHKKKQKEILHQYYPSIIHNYKLTRFYSKILKNIKNIHSIICFVGQTEIKINNIQFLLLNKTHLLVLIFKRLIYFYLHIYKIYGP